MPTKHEITLTQYDDIDDEVPGPHFSWTCGCGATSEGYGDDRDTAYELAHIEHLDDLRPETADDPS